MSKRSDLKENILAEKLDVATQWMMSHRPVVIGGLSMIVLVALVSSVFVIRKKELREVNWTRIAQAQALLNQKQYTAAKQILDDIRNALPGDTVSLHALFYSADAAMAEKKYEDAKQMLITLIDQSGRLPIRPLALQNLGFAYEQTKDYETAAATYRKFLDQYGEHFMAARAQLALGRSLILAGKPDDAKKALEQLIDLYPSSDWAENARQIMDKSITR